MSSLLGQQVQPFTPNPIVGTGNQNSFINSLFNSTVGANGFKGLPGYGGPTSPSMGNTILPGVTGAWNPQDAGQNYLSQMLYNGGPNGLNVGRASPYTNQMMQWGGTGGPANQAMSLLMQYGAPSQAGKGISDWAQGNLTGGAQYLAPFLQGGVKPYTVPNVP